MLFTTGTFYLGLSSLLSTDSSGGVFPLVVAEQEWFDPADEICS